MTLGCSKKDKGDAIKGLFTQQCHTLFSSLLMWQQQAFKGHFLLRCWNQMWDEGQLQIRRSLDHSETSL